MTGLAFDELVEAFRPDATQMIDGEIAGQGKEPGIEIPANIESADLRSDTKPGLLEKILGIGGLAHQAEQIAVEPVLVALDERGESIEVSASKPGNVGVEGHRQLLHRAGKLAYHTVLYTNEEAKKTHEAATIIQGSSSQTPKLEITPNPAFVDEPVIVRLSGIQPRVKVTLRAAVRDSAGREWCSSAVFIATAEGNIDTSAQESIEGSYRGVDCGGLFWSMGTAGDEQGVAFDKNNAEPDRVSVTAEAEGEQIASAMLERHWLAPGTEARELDAGGKVGSLYIPPGSERRKAVIVVGGSGGGYDLDKAALLSRHGFAALALAYFGVPPLPNWLHRVPLEYFAGAMEWLGAQEEVDASSVGVLGISRGAELALLLGSYFPQIRAVVAYAPSAVTWSSGGHDKETGEPIPCWTWKNQAIPCAPLPLRGFIARSVIPVGLLRHPVKFHNLFESALRNREAVQAAAIRAERTHGPILLISGGDDQVWPALRMSEMIEEQLKSHSFRYPVEHVHYPHAGHSLRYPSIPTTTRVLRSRSVKFPILLGGTAAADARAQEDAWRRAVDFFQRNL